MGRLNKTKTVRNRVNRRTIIGWLIGTAMTSAMAPMAAAKGDAFQVVSRAIGIETVLASAASENGPDLAQSDYFIDPGARTADNGLVPLSNVLRRLRAQYPGKHLDVNVIRGPNPRYIVIWLTPDGRRLDIVVDARSGQIISGG